METTNLGTLIGLRIKAARELLGMSKTQAADEAGLTRITLLQIENGAANPSLETLSRICAVLKMDLGELFSSDRFDYEQQVFLQPIGGTLLDFLTREMSGGGYDCCQIHVAYAKSSGVDLVTGPMLAMREAGGRVDAFIGVDQKNTTAEALYKLLSICSSLYVIHDRALAQTYHPKLYLLSNSERVWLTVGSNNLTRGGLLTNYECCAVQVLDRGAPQRERIYTGIQDAVQQYHSLSLSRKITCVEDIRQLLYDGLISTEQESRMGAGGSAGANSSGFGHRPIPELPTPSVRIPVPAGIFALPAGEDGGEDGSPAAPEQGEAGGMDPGILLESRPGVQATYWFYAGKLTGGSRNILDLSESAVLRFGTHPRRNANGSIPGGVSLFGLDPKDHGAQKDLSIFYNGTWYQFSTIKYAPGNSNWRFQLKGNAEVGKGSLAQFGADFVDRVLIFHKVSDDRCILEIMDQDKLPVLKRHSSFWATNGKTKAGRPFGVL